MHAWNATMHYLISHNHVVWKCCIGVILDVSNVVCGLGILIFKQINKNHDLNIAISSLIFVLQKVILWVTGVLILLDSALNYQANAIGFNQKSFLEMILWSEYHSEVILV